MRVEQGGESQAAVADRVAARRAAMPVVSTFIDWARRSVGADCVDAAMAKGMAAARQFAHIQATQGQEAADAWHRNHAHLCTFVAVENGRTVGLDLPVNRSATESTKPASPRVRRLPGIAYSSDHPPVGTPELVQRQGNSAPARSLAAGLGKSERSGERGGIR